ncbi:MAG: alpha-galactosidase [Ruminococcaceae bacterium]|nr:alpha-galactosidase [Oscillospiraceae bacterium]
MSVDLGFKLYFSNKTVFIPRSSLHGETIGNTTTYKTEIDGIKIIWLFEKQAKGTIVKLSAVSNKPLQLERADTLCLEPVVFALTDRIVFFTNSHTRSGNRYPCELTEDTERFADCTGLFSDLTSQGIILATVAPFANIVGACALKHGNTVIFSAKTEFTEGMKSECGFESDRVLFAENVTIDEFYDMYRALLPQSTFPMPKLIGWNSWDYYLDRVTPEDIFENMEAISKMPFADKIKYIVIDDGWQKDWGVWTENDKFTCGLASIAERIVKAGFWAGIWMAPLLMKDTCDGFESRLHWFLKDENGEYVREIYNTYILDPTHPEAKAFILNNYRYLYSCGYRLFKIDYLTALLSLKNFYDRSATPYSALTRLIQEIQNCTGPDAVILGCSLPIQCGADIAPSMRIGIDVHNHFSHIEWIAESLSWTWMYNNKVTRIDPDFMIVRGSETSSESLIWEEGTPKYIAPKRLCEMTDEEFFASRWRNGDQFNAVEAETWANLIAITGGNIFLSDRMSALNDKGISIIEKAFAASSEEGRPKFLPDDRRLPSLWLSENTLFLVNWEDVPVVKTIDCDAKILSSDKNFTFENNKLIVSLLPHESFLAFMK